MCVEAFTACDLTDWAAAVDVDVFVCLVCIFCVAVRSIRCAHVCECVSQAHLLSVPRGADEILCQNGHDHLHLQIVIKGSNPQNMIKLPQGITYDV